MSKENQIFGIVPTDDDPLQKEMIFKFSNGAGRVNHLDNNEDHDPDFKKKKAQRSF